MAGKQKKWKKEKRNKEKFSSSRLKEVYFDYCKCYHVDTRYDLISYDQSRKIFLWIENLLSFDECFSKKSLKSILLN